MFFVNQVLVTAFVDQVWHGDPAPVTRYLPPGWFDLADLGPLPGHCPPGRGPSCTYKRPWSCRL
ncbi:hypothetical protein P9139_06550 [Curtobacterium flaccumfaciens]|nr:hypothetical protein P9139_06550 [Curtobacterium flaccumfaciens]